MYFIKLSQTSGDIIGIEQREYLEYVCQNDRGKLLRCSERNAQGIISADGSTVYQIRDRPAMTGDRVIADFITGAEYDELRKTFEADPEDNDPEIPEGSTDPELMTRAELTAKVREQDEEIRSLNEQIELLLSGVKA